MKKNIIVRSVANLFPVTILSSVMVKSPMVPGSLIVYEGSDAKAADGLMWNCPIFWFPVNTTSQKSSKPNWIIPATTAQLMIQPSEDGWYVLPKSRSKSKECFVSSGPIYIAGTVHFQPPFLYSSPIGGKVPVG